MDERIMKVLEAAGARIAELEAKLQVQSDEAVDAKNEVEKLKSTIDEKDRSISYWYTESTRLEGEGKKLKAERATVEAVD